MQNELTPDQYILPKKLTSLGEFLTTFSENSSFPVALKEIHTPHDLSKGKILMHNGASADLRGFEKAGMVGMTIHDILEARVLSHEAREKELKAIEENDREVVETMEQKTHNQITLDSQGFVRIYQRVVTPVFGSSKSATALCTVSMEITPYTNLLYLMTLYRSYYAKKNMAIEALFRHLKLDQYFMSPLNCRELSTLLAMAQGEKHRQVAALLQLSIKTVDGYVDALRYKLKTGMMLEIVLNALRVGRQWTPDN
jgi:hypothetical protein